MRWQYQDELTKAVETGKQFEAAILELTALGFCPQPMGLEIVDVFDIFCKSINEKERTYRQDTLCHECLKQAVIKRVQKECKNG